MTSKETTKTKCLTKQQIWFCEQFVSIICFCVLLGYKVYDWYKIDVGFYVKPRRNQGRNKTETDRTCLLLSHEGTTSNFVWTIKYNDALSTNKSKRSDRKRLQRLIRVCPPLHTRSHFIQVHDSQSHLIDGILVFHQIRYGMEAPTYNALANKPSACNTKAPLSYQQRHDNKLVWRQVRDAVGLAWMEVFLCNVTLRSSLAAPLSLAKIACENKP